MFRSILFAAAIAGILAGIFVTAAQMVRVLPIVFEAETYETAGAGHDRGAAAAHDQAAGIAAHDHGAAGAGGEEWAPEDGLERGFFTLTANLVTGFGFALLLAAGLTLKGGGSDWRRGLLWGLAGFLVFTLAPAIGLPPEIPGAAAAELGARQLWWLLAVATTGAGLALVAWSRRLPWAVLGIALLLLPHAVGAPQPEAHGGLAPDWLARDFVIAALATSFIFWAVLGGLTGHFLQRFSPRRA
ncbi:MAG: CbtA family protein [Kiloniellales bacterium]